MIEFTEWKFNDLIFANKSFFINIIKVLANLREKIDYLAWFAQSLNWSISYP